MNRKAIFAFIVLISLPLLAFAVDAPSSVKAVYDQKDNSVSISWDGVTGASGYNVYRKQISDNSFQKLNFSPVNSSPYRDGSITRGGDYLFMARAVDQSGSESINSPEIGAPLMTIDVKAAVTTGRSRPLEAKSIRTGNLVTFAAPGDLITYSISYCNQGCSSSKNVSIKYDIPSGTLIAGAPKIKKGPAARIAYFDKFKNSWVNKIGKERNISKVKFEITEAVPPVAQEKDVNGMIDLGVMINL